MKITNKKTLKKRIKLAIFPHDKNDYRPHLIRHYGIVSVVCIVLGIQIGVNIATSGNVLGYKTDITISSLVAKTNEERAKNKVEPLTSNDKLNQAAYFKAQDMIENQYWDHESPTGVKPWKWLADVGYNYDTAGENLAKDFASTDAVMSAWMNSPEHKKNILNSDFQDVGFAITEGTLNGKETTLIVALYGLSVEGLLQSETSTFVGAMSDKDTSLMSKISFAVKSFNPFIIVGFGLVIGAILVSIITHIYQKRLPKKYQKTWYRRYHGMFKAIGLGMFAVAIILIYSGGII